MSTDSGRPTGDVLTQARLAEVFVTLADTLVDDYDVVELMERLTGACVDLLGAAAAGLLIIDLRGSIQVIASSSEQMHVLDVLQVQANEGPCRDCVRTGAVVRADELIEELERWPRFGRVAVEAGFTSLVALPLRLRSETLGALNLFFTTGGNLSENDERIAQALADVATIGVLQQRAVHRSTVVAEQLQQALNSRVVIEQAKGMLAEHLRMDMDAAFDELRTYARNRNLRLTPLATALTKGEVLPADIAAGRRYPPRLGRAEGISPNSRGA